MATSWLGSEGSDPYTHHIRVPTRIWADCSRSMLAELLHNLCTPFPTVLGPSYLNLIQWSRLNWGRQEMALVFHLHLRARKHTTLTAWWRQRSRRGGISWRQRASEWRLYPHSRWKYSLMNDCEVFIHYNINKDESSHSLLENLSNTTASHTSGFKIFHSYGGIICLEPEWGTLLDLTSVEPKKVKVLDPVSWRPGSVLSHSFLLPL